MQPFNTKYRRLRHPGQMPVLIFEVTRTDQISLAVFEAIPLLFEPLRAGDYDRQPIVAIRPGPSGSTESCIRKNRPVIVEPTR
jgi:hypothetical protein